MSTETFLQGYEEVETFEADEDDEYEEEEVSRVVPSTGASKLGVKRLYM